MKARLSVGIVGVLASLTVPLVAFAGAPGAVATQGQAILAGVANSETHITTVYNTSSGYTADTCQSNASGGGLVACGNVAIEGDASLTGVIGDGGQIGVQAYGGTEGVHAAGSTMGVWGYGATAGIEGHTDTGAGVFGQNDGSTGSGVQGQTGGVGSGVYGVATANGVAVFGDTTSGVGLQGRSTTGPALNVLGRAQFSSTGIAVVGATQARVTVKHVRLTSSSFVLATIQANVGQTWVRGVRLSIRTSSFTIYLNQAVKDSTFVGWFVVD